MIMLKVAYLWAKSLGGDAAVKLLQRFKLLDDSIDFACENGLVLLLNVNQAVWLI